MAPSGKPVPRLRFTLQPRSCMPMPFMYPNLVVEADYAEGGSPFPPGRGKLRLKVVRQSDGKDCVVEDGVYAIVNGWHLTHEESTKYYAVFKGPVFEQGRDWSIPKETREDKLKRAEELIEFLESSPKDVEYRFRIEYFALKDDSKPATAVESNSFSWMACDGLTEAHKQMAKDGQGGCYLGDEEKRLMQLCELHSGLFEFFWMPEVLGSRVA
ncbi:hypothetical protein F5Y18DRAFT_402219 [Xylariaceae sp. FL1019]|nr:hypothetical protein F5Y18DRAFT_402219 [Xylariaceae sp. FL1019]